MQIYLIFFLEGHYFLDIQYIKHCNYRRIIIHFTYSSILTDILNVYFIYKCYLSLYLILQLFYTRCKKPHFYLLTYINVYTLYIISIFLVYSTKYNLYITYIIIYVISIPAVHICWYVLYILPI